MGNTHCLPIPAHVFHGRRAPAGHRAGRHSCRAVAARPTKVSNQLHAGQQAVFVNLRRGLPGGNDGSADGRLCSRPDTIAETAEFSWQQSGMPSTIQKYE